MRKVLNGSTLAVLVLVTGIALVGCGKAPEQDVMAAEQAVSDAKAAEAQAYATQELSRAQASLDAAKAEIDAQNQKWFKNFDKAKEMLASAKTEAETAKTAAATNKEQARQDADAAIAAARTAIETAEGSLKAAPVGKGTKADIDLYTADLEGLKTQLSEAEAAMTAGKYNEARDRATAVRDKADQINSDLQAVIEKRAGRRA